jgi:hypothetical protein
MLIADLSISTTFRIMEKNYYRITIDDERKMIHYQHNGFLKIEEIGEAWRRLLELKEFTSLGYNLLSDYSEADFDFSINKAELIWDFLYSIQDILKNKRGAVVTSKPVSTAISVLFEAETYRNLKFELKTFSTREVALDWLRL